MDIRNGSAGKNVIMNKKVIYKNIAEFGNKNIVYMTTRSLFPIEQALEVKIDLRRLNDELELYKYFLNKGKGSIISALLPLILSNAVYEKAVINACELYSLIRKKISIQNKIGINLLTFYVYSMLEENCEFSKLNMINSTKEEEVEFQRNKINIILKKNSIEESIVNLLEETEDKVNVSALEKLKEDVIHEDNYLEQMSIYFQKVCLFQIKKKPYDEKINMGQVFNSEVNQSYKAPVIGEYYIKRKEKIGDKTVISLSAKMGELELCYKTQASGH